MDKKTQALIVYLAQASVELQSLPPNHQAFLFSHWLQGCDTQVVVKVVEEGVKHPTVC